MWRKVKPKKPEEGRKSPKVAVAGLTGDDGPIAGVSLVCFSQFFSFIGRVAVAIVPSIIYDATKVVRRRTRAVPQPFQGPLRLGFVLRGRGNTHGSTSFRAGSTRNPGLLSDAIPSGWPRGVVQYFGILANGRRLRRCVSLAAPQGSRSGFSSWLDACRGIEGRIEPVDDELIPVRTKQLEQLRLGEGQGVQLGCD